MRRQKEHYDIEWSRKSFVLPNVLSVNELLAIIQESGSLKHKVILGTVYLAGLRRGELINLRIRDKLILKHGMIITGKQCSGGRMSKIQC